MAVLSTVINLSRRARMESLPAVLSRAGMAGTQIFSRSQSESHKSQLRACYNKSKLGGTRERTSIGICCFYRPIRAIR